MCYPCLVQGVFLKILQWIVYVGSWSSSKVSLGPDPKLDPTKPEQIVTIPCTPHLKRGPFPQTRGVLPPLSPCLHLPLLCAVHLPPGAGRLTLCTIQNHTVVDSAKATPKGRLCRKTFFLEWSVSSQLGDPRQNA